MLAFNRLFSRFREEKAIEKDIFHFYTVLKVGTILGFIGHAMFIILFTWLEIKVLALYNILSCSIFFTCSIINRRGHHRLSQILGTIEVLVHGCLAVYFVGWDSGFHYYLISILVITFLSPGDSKAYKIFISSIFCGIYVALNLYSVTYDPVFLLRQSTINVLNVINIMAIFIILAACTYYYIKATNIAEAELIEANEKLQLLASTDPLTNLLNRRDIVRDMDMGAKFHKENDIPFTIIISDIDNFKSYNDTYGHECGDFVLVSLSKIIQHSLNIDYRISRWGGEEFLILLPNTDKKVGEIVAERLREKINNTVFCFKGIKIKVTMTFGVADYHSSMEIIDCIDKADQALLSGKRKGKNCVSVA